MERTTPLLTELRQHKWATAVGPPSPLASYVMLRGTTHSFCLLKKVIIIRSSAALWLIDSPDAARFEIHMQTRMYRISVYNINVFASDPSTFMVAQASCFGFGWSMIVLSSLARIESFSTTTQPSWRTKKKRKRSPARTRINI